MVKKRWYFLIFFIFLICALISCGILDYLRNSYLLNITILITYDYLNLNSINVSYYIFYFYKESTLSLDQLPRSFYSWLLIGVWLCYTVKFFQLIKYHREFNSPHNTSFFIFGSVSIGMLYSMWGNYTGLLGTNLIGTGIQNPLIESGFKLYISPWVLIFALPYFLYSLYSLYSCFKRYFIVHVGQKSINARKFGNICTFLIILFEIGYFLLFYVFIDFNYFPLKPIHKNPSLILIFLSFYALILSIRYGKPSEPPTMPEITTEVRIPTIPTTPRRATVRQKPRPRRTIERSTSATRRRKTVPQVRRTKRRPTVKKSGKKKTKISRKLRDLLPKAGVMTADDFKCIFCFQLPKSSDQGRGIVLCPKCKHPAHADAFKDWLRSSSLCSRCGATIPARFRRNPKIIPVKLYLQVYEIYKRKKKKK